MAKNICLIEYESTKNIVYQLNNTDYTLWDELYISTKPSDAYMRQYARLSLLQIKTCRIPGAKLLSEPMMDFC